MWRVGGGGLVVTRRNRHAASAAAKDLHLQSRRSDLTSGRNCAAAESAKDCSPRLCEQCDGCLSLL
jgi:hypothetical protein